MRRTEAVNTFAEGMVMDSNPISTPNNVLVNALNATLVTMNGNENVLLNDMGNGRVQTACLPEGYIPLGTTLLGGIIYIVSYNPLNGKCLIGSFPSPERNISSSSIGLENLQLLSSNFLSDNNEINSTLVKLKLSNLTLHAGDKYIICSQDLSNNWKYITDCYYDLETSKDAPRNIKLSIATIDSNGRIIKLSNLKRYSSKSGLTGDYIIADGQITDSSLDIDTYRSVVNSEYNVYSSKISGELYLIAELEVIDKFNVTYKCIKYSDNIYTLRFYINTSPSDIFIKYIKVLKGDETYYFERTENETDNLTFDIKFDISNGQLFNLVLTPCMSYGLINLLSTQIYIDLSLLGTGIMSNSLWKYYKDDSSISINWNLNANPTDTLEITSVQLKAREFSSDEDKIIESLDSRQAYSGSITSKINFSDNFKSNTLYFCTIQINIIDRSGKLPLITNKVIKKCLYTNGVFNEVYINNPLELDYDTISPELTYKVDFTLTNNILSELITKKQDLCTEEEPSTNFRGAEITKYSGNIVLTPKAGFINDYENSFSVDVNDLNITLNNNTSTIDRKVNKVSTDNIFNDTDYMDKEAEVVDTITPIESIDYLDMKDLYSPSVSKAGSNININVNGVIYNKISADNTYGNISVTNYITPIVYNEETASKYGLQVSHATNGGHFYMSTEYISVGISGGGMLSTGGGSNYYSVGKRRVVLGSNNTIGYTEPEMMTSSTSAVELTSGDILQVAQDIDTDLSIIPVIHIKVGNGNAAILSPSIVNSSYFNYNATGSTKTSLLEKNNINILGNNGNERLGIFKLPASNLQYLTVQLFMKLLNGNIVATNNYFPIIDTYSTLLITNNSSIPLEETLGDVLGSLLTLLYVKLGTGSINGYYVNNILYYSQINETWNTEINYLLSNNGNNADILKLNNYTIQNILNKFKEWNPESSIYNCLNINTKFQLDNYKINSKFNILIQKPDLLNLYLTTKSNPIVDTYVITINNLKLDEICLISDYNIYTIHNNKLVLNYSIEGNYISKIIYNPDNDRISIEYSNIKAFNQLDASNLYWDYRNKLLKLKDYYVLLGYKTSYKLKYAAYNRPDETKATVNHPNIKIFNNCNTVN